VTLRFQHLHDEVAILQRLVYKNKNQHRASKHLQAVCQVRRVQAAAMLLQGIAMVCLCCGRVRDSSLWAASLVVNASWTCC
jgi:hypothetical protein